MKEDAFTLLLRKDVSGAVELYCDRIEPMLREGRRFELRYNSDALDASYAAIMNAYVQILNARFPASEFKLIKSSFDDDRMFEVKCYPKGGGQLIGESSLSVRPEEGELREYFIRVVSMMNIAIAASTVRDTDSGEYDTIASYISNQYGLLTGATLALTGARHEDLKKLKRLSITLPKAHRLDFNDRVRRNAALIELLKSA
jgi:hypothetical protein